MPITNLDEIISGLQQRDNFMKISAGLRVDRLHSLFYATGFPAAAAAPPLESTAGNNARSGSALTSYPNQLFGWNNSTGSTHIARITLSCNTPGRVYICDRLWHNSMNTTAVTSSITQIVSSSNWPSRDSNGLTLGEDILIGAEVSTTMGAGSPFWSMRYVNSTGGDGRTATTTNIAPFTTVGSFFILPLQLGDTGVRSIDSFTLSSTMTSGVFSLVAFRLLCSVDILFANQSVTADALSLGLPRGFDNTVPFLLFSPNTTATPIITGMIQQTIGS